MYNISDESFAPYRVTWKRMASRMEATVLSRMQDSFGLKAVVSTDTTSFIPVEDKEEAHYLCAILNSSLVDGYIRSFSSGGRGFGAPSVVKNLAIPKFSASKSLHKKLAELSQDAHARVESQRDIGDLQKEINESAEELWTIKN